MKKLIDNKLFYTDKNTTHSYLPLYEKLLNPIHTTAKHILEVGIGDFHEKNGGSIMMWADFFEASQIHAVDILPKERVYDELFINQQIHVYCESNAYEHEFVKKQFEDNNIKFDFVIDDGPHTLESMVSLIELYHKLLTPKGILIIEDVQSIDWFEELTNATPDHLKKYVKTYDLRKNKGRYDDLVFTIDQLN
jgi:cephalosporin hydroxylase